MKIYMGPYRSWYISPYMLTERLKIFGVSEERRDAIAEYLRGTWVLGAGAGAGALFGSFWGPGVVIWSPFWVI